MPQSYRFHHFTPHKPGATPERPHGKSPGETPGPEQGLHYGHRFSETEERIHHRPPPPAPATRSAVPQHPIPIGALPAAEPPPRWEELESLVQAPSEELAGLVVGRVRRWLEAVRDLGRASRGLIRLPVEVLRGRRGGRRIA